MSKMSRDKGKVGEREAAALIRSFGFDAKRGVQYSGGTDSPDVQHSIPGVHIEVKRVEKLNIRMAMKQAREDAKEKTAIVLHRTNNAPWLVTMEAADWLLMARQRDSAMRAIERIAYPPQIIKGDNGQDNVGRDAAEIGRGEPQAVGVGKETAGGIGPSGSRLDSAPSRAFDVV